MNARGQSEGATASSSATARPAAALGWLLLAGFSASAAWIGNIYDGAPIVAGAEMNTLRAWQIVYAAGVLGYLLLLWSFRTRPAGTRTILIVAVALRLPLLFCPPNSDTNRYAWEGHIQRLGFSPYTAGPLDPRLEPHRDEIWEGINKKKFPTIYPPLSELEFRLLSTIHYGIKPPRLLFLKVRNLTKIRFHIVARPAAP